MTVDLREKTVTGPDDNVDRFEIAEFAWDCLLDGLDEIELIFSNASAIEAYQRANAVHRPRL